MKNRKQGFTLIELSIVLVIIGLVVGGVLVGQDLIKASAIRATVAQIEKYNTAINTFQTKFNGLPGDISAVKASYFGLYTAAGTTGRGNGNGVFEAVFPGGSASGCNCTWTQEGGIFWVHLSGANLIDGAFNYALDNNSPTAITTAASLSGTFPLSSIGRGNYLNVGSYSGTNYLMITGIVSTNGFGQMRSNANLTPIEVYNMDVKLDDGGPLTGIVQTHGTAGTSSTTFSDAPSSAASATKGTCLVGDTVGTNPTDIYNLNLFSGADSPACIARFQFN